MPEDRFAGKVAVITGGAAGFGRAVAERLAREGATLLVVDRDRENLEATARELPSATPVVADVSQEGEVDGYVAQAVERHGRIDLFFNNAGIEGRMAPMTELSVEDYDRVMAVNARGVFLGLRAVLKVMKGQEGGGAIVNTASMAGIRGAATFSPYVAAKHAVVGLTRCAALEGAPHGIRVNGVAPGHIDTRMARALTAQIDPDDPDGVFDRVSASVPAGRYGTAVEVANLVCWLLSDEASYMSGSTYLIDGALNA